MIGQILSLLIVVATCGLAASALPSLARQPVRVRPMPPTTDVDAETDSR
jgi:hypothetical protein